MKKIISVTLLLVLLAMFTGCVRYDMTIKVNKNGTVDMSFIYATENSLQSITEDSEDAHSGILSEEEIAQYIEQGFEVGDYKASGYTGYVISKTGMTFDAMNNFPVVEGLSVEHTRSGLLHKIDIDISNVEDMAGLADYASVIKETGGSATITIQLPVKVEKHNATSTSEDGKALTWDLLTMNTAEPMHLEFRLISTGTVIGAGAAVLCIIVVIVIISKKKKNRISEENDLTIVDEEKESEDLNC